jgi:hypothetical protein
VGFEGHKDQSNGYSRQYPGATKLKRDKDVHIKDGHARKG